MVTIELERLFSVCLMATPCVLTLKLHGSSATFGRTVFNVRPFSIPRLSFEEAFGFEENVSAQDEKRTDYMYQQSAVFNDINYHVRTPHPYAMSSISSPLLTSTAGKAAIEDVVHLLAWKPSSPRVLFGPVNVLGDSIPKAGQARR